MDRTRIGVFGGTFDPPHIGHLILAAEACEQLGLEQLFWVLTPDPPHKKDRRMTNLDQRLDMLVAATKNNPSFELSRVDIDRPGPHYALDTIRLLSRDYPQACLVYLIGGDSLHDLPSWFQPQQVVREVDLFGVMRRPGDDVNFEELEKLLPGLFAKVKWIQAPLLEISSSHIRERIVDDRHYRYFLPEPVFAIIRDRQLYKTPSNR